MSEAEDAAVEYRESKFADLSLDKDYDEMNRAELRGSIVREVGKNREWHTPLTKDTLNSIIAYLTGRWYIPKKALNRPDHNDFATRQEVLEAVVWEVPISVMAETDDDGELEDEDGLDKWSHPELRSPDQLRRDELQELREEMSDRTDQRHPDTRADGQQ